MPVQAPQWTEFLLCPICTQTFEETIRKPISLGCGHTVCKMCLNKLHRKACPFDQTAINTDIEQLPVNSALLQLVGGQVPKQQPVALLTCAEDVEHYEESCMSVEELALYLKPLSSTRGVGGLNSTAQSMLSRPMQRKLVTLVHCQLVEEEGRIRAMRAARSLGERTVTELILQHQNPQQLSSNLWAAVRARGCQFLGPAMQEEALKLVLLALEDGSALSRKVLVLFVVQRLEPRFPQASKTSIGHVVQLLYRASCFKVTKRDEDSSLMQLKEEFRTYEALRREHDSQIVQIAMEGGLRIAPDQWSSLLYGDQSHKSHMQSIIDKLQTPASFAQSVQELTIALQRTGDPANLNRLRPHLELLANIDPSPDAPPPTWDQLEKGLVAVKTVVHGLVDFIQNHSKKGADQQQPPQHSKYKTYMCRDMKQKGGCPRGASCTFAHSQEELEKYRKMNKRLAARRPLSQSLTQLNEEGVPCSPGLLPEDAVALEGLARKPNGIAVAGPGSALTPLISRGTDSAYDTARKPIKMETVSPNGPGSPPDPLDPVSKTAMPLNPHMVSHPRIAGDHLPTAKQMPLVNRGPQMYPQQQPEMFYPEPRPAASASQYPAGNPYSYHPPQYVPQRYVRNAPPPNEPGMPPYQDPYPGYVPERPYTGPQFSPAAQHVYPSHYDGRRHAPYGTPPPPQPFPPRDELVRMSPVPVDVPPPPPPPVAGSPYHPESSRDRYAPEGYCPVTPHHGQRSYIRDLYSRSQPSLDYLHRRRKEIMAQLEERKVISPPPFAPSPTLPRTFPAEYPQEQYMEDNLKAFEKCREPDYAGQYSPWSCDTIGSYMVTKDVKPKDVMATGAMEMNVDGKSLREPRLDTPRRSAEAKDDDPIIPFGSLPTVSRFGAISRTSKTGYQPACPIQAMAPTQGSGTKHMAVPEYTYGNHAGWSGGSYPPHQTTPSQGHFSERLPMPAPDREQLKMELQQVNQQINQHTQIHSMEAASNTLLRHRDPGGLAGPSGPKWPAGGVSSEQLSLELHHVEREIGKRTREIAMESQVQHEIQYKLNVTENGQSDHAVQLKATENGQSDHTVQLDDLTLALSGSSNGSSSSLVQDGSMLSLTSKASSLSLSSDSPPSSSDLQKNGVVHSCS
ncbi:roquin-1-like isoform X2 [Megalops cyprinoides]|uniref:roquin-1-like isoform X2 n=1 Tax=Megalops cyprinoides TaxID=118141 RepID=UPI001863B8A2|nr:roquin-1-like isoform X2 [Megalops cyprinoides]